MRRLLLVTAAAGLLALPFSTAAAQTNLNFWQQFGPSTSVVYTPFHVAVGGTFTLHTSGLNPVDPIIWLFTGAAFDGSGLGTAVAMNDDGSIPEPWNGGGSWYCLSTPTCHSTIIEFLNEGDYTVAASVWDLTEQGARDGIGGVGGQMGFDVCKVGDDWSNCGYNLALTGDGVATAVTPEPTTILLLGTGLLGLAGLRRRKNRA